MAIHFSTINVLQMAAQFTVEADPLAERKLLFVYVFVNITNKNVNIHS